jgi:hypothetical protein
MSGKRLCLGLAFDLLLATSFGLNSVAAAAEQTAGLVVRWPL